MGELTALPHTTGKAPPPLVSSTLIVSRTPPSPDQPTGLRESQFYRQLDSVGKRRHREKLDMLHLDMDPYLTTPDVWIGSPESWPDVTYLLFSPSPCTKDDLKAYKSTEAWKYVTSCYVSGIKLLKISADLCWLQPRYMYNSHEIKIFNITFIASPL